jgi:hypothetical protein
MRRTLLTLWGVCFYMFFFATVTQADSPTYFYVQAQHSGKCVHQQGSIKGNGGLVSQWECLNQGNVKLEKVALGSGYFFLRFPHSNKCLTVRDDVIANGIPLIQYECIEGAPRNQSWREVKTDTPPYVKIESSLGTCLHQTGGILSNGGELSAWECIDQPNVRWQFIPAPAELSSCPVATYSNGKLKIPAVEVADSSFVGVSSYKVDMDLINPLPLRFEVTTAVRNP